MSTAAGTTAWHRLSGSSDGRAATVRVPRLAIATDGRQAAAREEMLFDIGAEALAVDRPIEYGRPKELVTAERAQEGQRSPVAVRRKAAQPLALGPRPRSGAMLVLIQVLSMNTSRLGSRRSWRLRQRCRAARRRRGPAQGRTVFFLKLRPSRRRNVHTAWCETFTPRAASSSFRPCSVRCGVWLIRSAMNARCGSRIGLRCPPILPGATECRAIALAHHQNGRHRNIEPGRHSMATLAGFHRPHGSFTKIIRKRSDHSMLASDPASILNDKPPPNGFPPDLINRSTGS